MSDLNAASRGKRVLVVDDSAFARRNARALTEKLGHQVTEAANGAAAVAACKASPPDLVLLDMVMSGGMDGAETLRHIRATNPSLPVIVATADHQDSTAAMMRSLGARGFITKPLTLDRLAEAISHAIVSVPAGRFEASHRVALSELINIGYHRAAAALSTMSGARVVLEAPDIAVSSLQLLESHLAQSFTQDVACVNQVFSGPLAGNAMLLLDCDAARILSGLLEQQSTPAAFDAHSREIITELGNVLLNACLGVFGNLLQLQVSFAVPRMHVDSAGGLLRSMSTTANGDLRHTVLVKTRFTLDDGSVSGYLVILLGIASLERLRLALELL